jgi:hypothetical protein
MALWLAASQSTAGVARRCTFADTHVIWHRHALRSRFRVPPVLRAHFQMIT